MCRINEHRRNHDRTTIARGYFLKPRHGRLHPFGQHERAALLRRGHRSTRTSGVRRRTRRHRDACVPLCCSSVRSPTTGTGFERLRTSFMSATVARHRLIATFQTQHPGPNRGMAAERRGRRLSIRGVQSSYSLGKFQSQSIPASPRRHTFDMGQVLQNSLAISGLQGEVTLQLPIATVVTQADSKA